MERRVTYKTVKVNKVFQELRRDVLQVRLLNISEELRDIAKVFDEVIFVNQGKNTDLKQLRKDADLYDKSLARKYGKPRSQQARRSENRA